MDQANSIHNFPKEALEVLNRLEENRFEGWIVGGAVRDHILDRSIHDVDITTNARPGQIQEIFADCRTIDVGISFGTVRVLWKEAVFEVTTYRADGAYEDGRHPTEVTYSDSLSDDLMRRDFTINAMAWNPRVGLVDLYGGQDDLRAGIIRAVGTASRRLKEDALRMLRGIRFASRLGFVLERDLYQEMQKQAQRISLVSVERILEELDAILLDRHAKRGLDLLQATGILPYILPELAAVDEDTFQLTKKVVNCCPTSLNLRWAALLRYVEEDAQKAADNARKILKRLHSSRDRIQTVGKLVALEQITAMPSMSLCRRMMGAWGSDFWDAFALLLAEDKVMGASNEAYLRELERLAKEVKEEGLATRVADLEISGKQLLLIGYKQGKIIGDTLEQLLTLVVEGKLDNTEEALMGEAKRRYRE